MFARRAAPQIDLADRTTTTVTDPAPVTDIPAAEKSFVVWYLARIQAFCIAELQKIRHDRSEMITRAVQPALWLVIFGQTVSRLDAIPTGDLTYEQFLATYAEEASIKRLNTIAEVAAMAVLLCSPEGAGINGAVLDVHGGTFLG